MASTDKQIADAAKSYYRNILDGRPHEAHRFKTALFSLVSEAPGFQYWPLKRKRGRPKKLKINCESTLLKSEKA